MSSACSRHRQRVVIAIQGISESDKESDSAINGNGGVVWCECGHGRIVVAIVVVLGKAGTVGVVVNVVVPFLSSSINDFLGWQ